MLSGQVDLLLVQGAVALPQVRAGTIQGARRTLAGTLGLDAGYSLGGRIRLGWTEYRRLVRVLRTEGRAGGCHRQAQRGDGGGAGRSRGDLDVAAREQQTPAGLATFQTAEMDKWWPIIKAAGIRGE